MDDETLLLEEYKQYSEAFWRNEDIGEKRVTFFTTLTTGVITAVVALQANAPDTLLLYTAALGGVLMFGVVTFLRLLQRDRVTEEYKAILDYVREELRQRAVGLDGYELPRGQKPHWALKGGLASTVALMNCALLSVLAALYADGPAKPLIVADVFVAFLVLQGLAIDTREAQRDELKRKVEKNRTDHSRTFRAGVGAAILNRDGRVLVLERKDVRDAWQMPQGGIEVGESPEQAILREIEEETGIQRRVLELDTRVPGLLVYELPKEYQSSKTGRGQVQHWFVYRFTGVDSEITLGNMKEFSAWKWVAVDDSVRRVVDFKRPVYQAVAAELASRSSRA